MLDNVTILGVLNRPTSMALDGIALSFTSWAEGKTFKLVVDRLSINMDTPFHLKWA